LACAIPAPAVAAAAVFRAQPSGPPPGFEQLEEPRELVVDVYFGGRKIGEAFASSTEGRLRFRNPQEILAEIPNVKADDALLAALSGELPTNSGLVCSKTNEGKCGSMAPDVASIIYDEDRFRADLFVQHPQEVADFGAAAVVKIFLRQPGVDRPGKLRIADEGGMGVEHVERAGVADRHQGQALAFGEREDSYVQCVKSGRVDCTQFPRAGAGG